MVGGDAKLMDRLYRLSPRARNAFVANQMKDLLRKGWPGQAPALAFAACPSA